MGYSKEEIEKKIDEALIKKAENKSDTALVNLYKEDFFNYAGQTKEENRYYTEVIIECLKEKGIIENGLIADIETQSRTKSAINPETGETIYYTPSHEELLEQFDESNKTNRVEENLMKKICKDRTENKQKYQDIIGSAIDFQVPLKSNRGDGYGKVDLLTYKLEKDENNPEDEGIGTLYIVEAKKQDSTETLLRACMEIQTYYQIIDKDILVEDYKKCFSQTIKKVDNVKKAVLIFKGSRPSNEYADIENRPNLKQLIKDFDIEVWDLEDYE